MEFLSQATNDELRKAIEIRCDSHFVAMLYANAFAGSKPIHWQLIYEYTSSVLLQEAIDRKLTVEEWHTALDKTPIKQSKTWLTFKSA